MFVLGAFLIDGGIVFGGDKKTHTGYVVEAEDMSMDEMAQLIAAMAKDQGKMTQSQAASMLIQMSRKKSRAAYRVEAIRSLSGQKAATDASGRRASKLAQLDNDPELHTLFVGFMVCKMYRIVESVGVVWITIAR